MSYSIPCASGLWYSDCRYPPDRMSDNDLVNRQGKICGGARERRPGIHYGTVVRCIDREAG